METLNDALIWLSNSGWADYRFNTTMNRDSVDEMLASAIYMRDDKDPDEVVIEVALSCGWIDQDDVDSIKR